jgi:hypothetical protein
MYFNENTTHLHDNDQLVNAFHSENDMKHISTLCEQNAEFLIVKAGGTYC